MRNAMSVKVIRDIWLVTNGGQLTSVDWWRRKTKIASPAVKKLTLDFLHIIILDNI